MVVKRNIVYASAFWCLLDVLLWSEVKATSTRSYVVAYPATQALSSVPAIHFLVFAWKSSFFTTSVELLNAQAAPLPLPVPLPLFADKWRSSVRHPHVRPHPAQHFASAFPTLCCAKAGRDSSLPERHQRATRRAARRTMSMCTSQIQLNSVSG